MRPCTFTPTDWISDLLACSDSSPPDGPDHRAHGPGAHPISHGFYGPDAHPRPYPRAHVRSDWGTDLVVPAVGRQHLRTDLVGTDACAEPFPANVAR